MLASARGIRTGAGPPQAASKSASSSDPLAPGTRVVSVPHQTRGSCPTRQKGCWHDGYCVKGCWSDLGSESSSDSAQHFPEAAEEEEILEDLSQEVHTYVDRSLEVVNVNMHTHHGKYA